MPAASAVLSVSVVSAAVTSTRIGFDSAWPAPNVTASLADARRPPARFASGVALALAAANPVRRRAGSDAGRTRNPEPHFQELRGAGAEVNAVDLMPRDLASKRRRQILANALAVNLGDAEADKLLGRRLADERDRDPFVVRR